MAQKYLSITLGNEKIRICEMIKKRSNQIQLLHEYSDDLEPGQIDDGQIIDFDGISRQIRVLLKKKRVNSKQVIFSISSRRIASKELMIPYVKNEKRIMDILRANKNEYFPMSNVGEYHFSYTVLETIVREEAKQFRIQAVAAPSELIESYENLSKLLGFNNIKIDYFGNSVHQLIKKFEKKDSSVVFLYPGKESVLVSVVKKQILVMQRFIPYGTEMVEQALKSQEIGLGQAISPITDSVSRILDYYSSLNRGEIISEVLMIWEKRENTNVEQAFSEQIGIPTRVIYDFKMIDFGTDKEISPVDRVELLVNLGSCLAPLEFLSMTEKTTAALEDEIKNKYYYYGLSAAILFVLLLGSISLVQYYGAKQENASLNDKIEAISNAKDVYQSYLESRDTYQTLTDFYDGTENSSEMAYNFILDLELIQPVEIGLENLTVSEGMVGFNATAYSKEEVAYFCSALESLDYVSDVFVSSMTETENSYGESVIAFGLTCVLSQEVEE